MISILSPTISGFKGQASINSLYITAGLRLANNPNWPLSPKSACSGRIFPGRVSHLGPPTAPRITASLFLHTWMVSFGRGSPVASIAHPPARRVLYSNVCPYIWPTLSKTLSPWLIISGPIPSPGITAIL